MSRIHGACGTSRQYNKGVVMGIRPERVANAIRREMSLIIREDMKDPRIGFITVTRVEITADLRYAKIYYSVLGDERSKRSTKIALDRARGYIKGLIGDRLKLRIAPDIRFLEDLSVAHGQKMHELFEKMARERTAESGPAESRDELP